MVNRPAVTQVDMVDDPDRLERVQSSVDGREMDVREAQLDPFCEVFGAQVRGLGDQNLDHRPSRGRDPAAICSEHYQSVGQPIVIQLLRFQPHTPNGSPLLIG